MPLNCTSEQLANIMSGVLMGVPVNLQAGISTDSRTIEQGDVFLALRGENFDGHSYLAEVSAKGAALAIVDAYNEQIALPQLVVDDTLRAYGQLGKLVRDFFVGPVFAITGSCGKTTSKEMLASVLGTDGRVLATAGNNNNEVGVPLTLTKLSNDFDFAIVEMGAAKLNDIAYLAEFVAPDYAMVTVIAPSHLEGFGSLENIAKTKFEIFSNTQNLRGCVINGDDAVTSVWRDALQRQGLRVYSFGLRSDNDVFASELSVNAMGTSFKLSAPQGQCQIDLNVPGQHMVMNALAVASLALMSGIELHDVARGLAGYTAIAGRQAKSEKWGVHVIDDSYNANPASMRAAIDTLALSPGRRVLVLGDMAELGAQSDALHQDIGRYAQGRVDALFCCGKKVQLTAEAFGDEARYFSDIKDLSMNLSEYLHTGDTLLVKGSRSSGMERVLVLLAQLKGEV